MDYLPAANYSPADFASWYAIPRSRESRIAIGGWVPKKSASRPDRLLSLRPSGSAMESEPRCCVP